ncbi:MFS transporter [Streptomyces sp. NPDC001795]|uniref:MFS transporter n=1 Tax=Streptomyces sp. NPDC001795 TaxID=3154525 RepID=UPI00332EC1C3
MRPPGRLRRRLHGLRLVDGVSPPHPRRLAGRRPLAYAAYQVGTVTGRACGDRLVRRIGPAAVVRTATLFTAAALAGLAAAPGWPYAVLAAGCAGLGVAVLVPLCLASAGRLRPDAAEDVLARLNAFNYAGVLLGAGVSGALGATGLFRLAYAVPAGLALVLLTTARHFGASPGAASTRVGG